MKDNSELKRAVNPSSGMSPGSGSPNMAAVNGFLQEAMRHVGSGDWEAAITACHKVLAIAPDSIQAHHLMAGVTLPGEHYLSLMRRIHGCLRPETYVEIGVASGDSLTLVQEGTTAIGVDPAPRIANTLLPGTRVFIEKSDDFFSRHDVRAELGGRPINLAFIDGMHKFEFALRDFINIERYCTSNSTVLVHDCFPLDEATAARERITSFWSGDIWKLIICLKKYRPELEIYTIASPPTGLGLVRHLDPRSTVLQENLQKICDEFIPLPYSAIANAKPQSLNIFPNVWLQVRALFS